MAEQLLKNPEIKPTSEVLADCLGKANSAYIKFSEKLKKHDIQLEYRYYTDGNAWLGKGVYRWTGPRGGKKEATVFWLSVWDKFFKVTFYIPEKLRAEVLNLPLDKEVLKTIEDAGQMGKLKFFPLIFDIDSDKLLDTLYILIDYKKTIK